MADDLKSLLKRGDAEHASRKSDAESRVVRWEYYAGVAHDPRPYYFERFNVKRGRPLKSATPKSYAYGFDADGRLAVVRQPKSDEPPYEEFFRRVSPALTTSIAYRTDGRTPKVIYATRYDYKAGRVVASDVLDAGGADQFTERYTYRDGRLTGIECRVRSARATKVHRFDVQYDEADGEFKVLRRFYEGLEMLLPMFWNPAKQPSLNEMADHLRKRLIDAIPKAVARAKVREPVYCLALEYDGLGEELPPTLALGRESDRRGWIDKLGVAKAAMRMWVPKRFSKYGKDRLSLDDAELEQACQSFGPLAISKNNHWIGHKVLCEVARELNGRDWKRTLNVTPDFVVVPTHADGHEFKKNLKMSAPPAVAKHLASQKFVYERSW